MNQSISTSSALRTRSASVSWGAVFVGLLLSLMTYLFLGILGTAIGTGAVDPIGERNPLAGFGTGASVWVGVSTLIALAVGGFFAGRSAPQKGILHGILAWAVTTLVSLYFISSLAGSAISTVSSVAGQGLALAGRGVAAAAPSVANSVKDQLQDSGLDLDTNALQGELDKLLRQTGKPELDPDRMKAQADGAAQDGKAVANQATSNPQAASGDLSAFFDRLKQKSQPSFDAADKEALVNVIVARTGKSKAEAEAIANNYEQTYKQAAAKFQEMKVQAEQKAREAAQATAKAVSKAAWAGVFLMLLGALVSAGAGHLGRRSNLKRERLLDREIV